MIKVVIADDEQKVCDLILHLVEWEVYDMRVVGIAHNGLEAIEMIREKNPELLITDIRMPGLDGLEMIKMAKEIQSDLKFVIISGYRHFEYAQNAIRHGVRDYLLKPIEEKELAEILKKMQEEYQMQHQQMTYEKQMMLTLKSDGERLRYTYLSDILYSANKYLISADLNIVNEKYHFGFQRGLFQMIAVRIDNLEDNCKCSQDFLTKKVRSAMKKYLGDLVIEWEIYIENNQCYGILNYQFYQKEAIRTALKRILDLLQVQEDIFENMKVTIGTGIPVENINMIQLSRKTAVYAVEERLFRGTGKVVDGENIRLTQVENTPLFLNFNRKFKMILENRKLNEVRNLIMELKRELLGMDHMTGHEVLQMTKEVANLYQLYIKDCGMKVEASFFEEFSSFADNCCSIEMLFAHLVKGIQHSLRGIIEEEKQADYRPIRIAKEYIEEHYHESVTLSEVSELVGFNVTYFSSLFKKETGQNFLEYLSGVRIDHAKQQLRESRNNVAVICEGVGYSDVKYFTKIFLKYTGLKPKEYRKLYS